MDNDLDKCQNLKTRNHLTILCHCSMHVEMQKSVHVRQHVHVRQQQMQVFNRDLKNYGVTNKHNKVGPYYRAIIYTSIDTNNGSHIWATVKLGDTLAFLVKPCCSC